MNTGALFQMAPAESGGGPIHASVTALFASMEEAKALTPFVEAKRALLVALASALDRELAGGKVSVAAATAVKQMNEIMDGLPNSGAGEDPGFDALLLVMESRTKQVLQGEEAGE